MVNRLLIFSMDTWEISACARFPWDKAHFEHGHVGNKCTGWTHGTTPFCVSTCGIGARSHGVWLVLSFDTWEAVAWAGFPSGNTCFEHRYFLSRFQLQFTSRFLTFIRPHYYGKELSHTLLDYWMARMILVNDDLNKFYPTINTFFIA